MRIEIRLTGTASTSSFCFLGVVAERWPPLAKKFRKGIMRDLGKTDEEARRMKVGTGCYLDVDCA